MVYIDSFDSPIGRMTMAGDGEALIGLWFDGQKYDRALIKDCETEAAELPVFDLTKKWLGIYFNGEMPDFTPPFKLSGSPFRQLIGSIMLEIPYGSVMTYGEIAAVAAARMGRDRMSAQAVGGAVGHNPISVIVPCHRVVGSDGSLTGYAGGVEKKVWLLRNEGIKPEGLGLYVPVKGTAL